MAGIFKPGQLVQIDPSMLSEGFNLELFNVPGGVPRLVGEKVNRIGTLKVGDVALVIARERTKAGDIYLLGPNGGGWAPAAFLKILVEPKVVNVSSAR